MSTPKKAISKLNRPSKKRLSHAKSVKNITRYIFLNDKKPKKHKLTKEEKDFLKEVL